MNTMKLKCVYDVPAAAYTAAMEARFVYHSSCNGT